MHSTLFNDSRPKKVFFTATTGRTGTTTLAEIFSCNVLDCIAEHEPKFQPKGIYERVYSGLYLRRAGGKERRGVGQAMQWYDQGDPLLERVVRIRARRIRRLRCRNYLESNHAFLSSMSDAMACEFPELGLIHLVRDPLEVAVSYCNRNFHPSGSPQFMNALGQWHPTPDLRKNCLVPPVGPLTSLQYYLWVWIEAELRCLRFLKRYPEIRCFHLDTYELSDRVRVAALMEFFGLETNNGQLIIPEVKNSNRIETTVKEWVYDEARDLLKRIDSDLLETLPFSYGLNKLAI